MKYNIQLANTLRATLFVRHDELYLKNGSHVLYVVKPEHAEIASQTWAVHGVCLSCRCLSITDGRCAECAIVYRSSLTGWHQEHAIADQLKRAYDVTKQAA